METNAIGNLGIGDIARMCQVDRGTVYNWIKHGVKVAGVRVRLAASRVGGRWRSDRERLDAWLAQTGQIEARPAPPNERKAKRRCERACEALRKRGISCGGVA